MKYEPPKKILETYQDGGVAILDQIICSHAKHFLGSVESTFTFRIQEEREIMGFSVDSTFGMLCKSGEFDCKKGTTWKIVYPDHQKRAYKSQQKHTELWWRLTQYHIFYALNNGNRNFND